MLRPTFTQLLFKRLSKGDSINLIGLPGAGGTECLEDVKQLAEAAGIVTVLLDMKDYKYNYQGLLRNTYQQMSNNGLLDGPKALPEGVNNLAVVVSEYTTQQTNTFILLDHFEDILDNPKQRLPKSFFDDLNSLRNRNNIALCCVTAKPHLHYKYHFTDEEGKLENTLSWLDLDVLVLPNLLDEEAAAAFDTQLGNHPLIQQEKGSRIAYIRLIQGHLHPAALLRIIQNDWDQHSNPIAIEHRLKRITRSFEEHYLRRPSKPSGWLRQLLDYAREISEIGKNIKG